MSLHPNDKRNFHGALAKHSPYRIRPFQCLGCGAWIDSSCLTVPGSRVCHACWRAGVRDRAEGGA